MTIRVTGAFSEEKDIRTLKSLIPWLNVVNNMEQENYQKSSGGLQVEGSIPVAFLDLLKHMDSENSMRANVLIAVCGAFLVLGFPQIDVAKSFLDLNNAGWAIIIIGSMLTILSSLIAIKPKNASNKDLNMYYPGSYRRLLSKEEYILKFKTMFRDDDLVLEELAKELYVYGAIVRKDAKKVEFSFYVLGISLILGSLVLMMSIFVI